MQEVDRLADQASVLALGRHAGLSAVGVAPAAVLQPARAVLQRRKAAGLAGEMQFTYRNPDRSTDPTMVLPGARSLIAGAWTYPVSTDSSDRPSTIPIGRVARYAWHDHYEDLRRALEVMAVALRAAGHRAVVVADANGLVDRNVAWLAGIGSYGKNANVLLPGAGSWVVLGAVVTDAELEPANEVVGDQCGSCTQCIDDCPTGAIVAPGVVDATRCLAWLVQADGWFPRQWRTALGDRIYGCDDCQEVCPPNRRPRSAESARAQEDLLAEDQTVVDITWLLTAPDQDILDRVGRWYIARRDVDNVRRSALVVLGNVATPDQAGIVELVRRYLRHRNPVLRGHAAWTAKRLGLDRLVDLVVDDPDPQVVEETEAEVEARFAASDWNVDRG